MFSGKTEELLRRIKRARLARQRTVLFKPRVDDRYDAVKVVTHEGVNADALPVATADELVSNIADDVAVVGIDEVQFFDLDVVDALDHSPTAACVSSRRASTRTIAVARSAPFPRSWRSPST